MYPPLYLYILFYLYIYMLPHPPQRSTYMYCFFCKCTKAPVSFAAFETGHVHCHVSHMMFSSTILLQIPSPSKENMFFETSGMCVLVLIIILLLIIILIIIIPFLLLLLLLVVVVVVVVVVLIVVLIIVLVLVLVFWRLTSPSLFEDLNRMNSVFCSHGLTLWSRSYPLVGGCIYWWIAGAGDRWWGVWRL